jgi:hypothetical protein
VSPAREEEEEDQMLTGSCACSAVRYEIRGELHGPIGHCHCWQCRKHSGASFGTTAAVKSEELVFVAGEDRLASWESSAGVHRVFASCCGSPIYKRIDAMPQLYGFRLGTLDTDPGRLASQHIFVSSKVPWVTLDDGLPQELGGCPFGERDG